MILREPDKRLFSLADFKEKLLGLALARGAEFAEIYYEDRKTARLGMESQKIETVVRGRTKGVGIRVIDHGNVSYAYTEDLSRRGMEGTAKIAAEIGASGRGRSCREGECHLIAPEHLLLRTSRDVPLREKADALRRVDEAARAESGEIIQVIASYHDFDQEVEIVNSRGIFVEDRRSFSWIMGEATGKRGEQREKAFRSIGSQQSMMCCSEGRAEEMGKELAGAVLRLLSAAPAPQGEIPVIIAPGEGVIVHEAIGHALEGDFISKGSSFYCGKLGSQVASRKVTIYDDGTIPYRISSYLHDDEGTPAQKTLLIKEGILAGYLFDRRSSSEFQKLSTGNGRRESFRYPPLPRMSCTYIESGRDDPSDLLYGIREGLYVTQVGGGRGDIGGGNFVFSALEGYLIERGRVTAPIKGTTLVGIGREVLSEIEGVGNDLALDRLPGYCGKGQMVPVSSGTPTIRLRKLIVGG
jgi:TldD protein